MEPRLSFAGSMPPRSGALRAPRARTAEALLWGTVATLTAVLAVLWALRPTLTSELPPDRIGPFAGLSYLSRPTFEPRWLYVVQSDGKKRPSGSELSLFENGAPLGPAHSAHSHIAEQGGGASVPLIPDFVGLVAGSPGAHGRRR